MNWWQIILTIFIFGGIVYNFAQSAEERGIDLFGGIYRLIRGLLLLLAYPLMVMIERKRRYKKDAPK